MAVGDGIVGVICSETITAEGDSVLGGAEGAGWFWAEGAAWFWAEAPSAAGAGPRDEAAASPTKGLWTAGTL